MPTVQEVLKQTGFTDEQIAAMDPRAITAFGSVQSAAEQERTAGQAALSQSELERRSNAEFYDSQIAPALNNWGSEKAAKDAEVAFYRAQFESAKSSGFMPSEAPGYQSQNAGGRYVAAAQGGTPGSPTFVPDMQELTQRVGGAIGTLSDIQWKYQSLYGKPMPISPTELIRQADAIKLDPASYAARTFNFQQKEQEVAKQAADAHDNQIRRDVEESVNRKWAEKIGSNPDIRIAQPSRFGEVARAVKAGDRPDPLQLNDAQRRMATSQAIRHEIAENGEAA